MQQVCASQVPRGPEMLTRRAQCAQGTGIGSDGSIAFRGILTITTLWGICSSLDSQPKTLQQVEFGHSSVTARPRNQRIKSPAISGVDTALFGKNPKGPIPIRWRWNQLSGKFMRIAPLKCSPQSFGTKGGIERTRCDEQVQVNQITNSAVGTGPRYREGMNLFRELLLAGDHRIRRRWDFCESGNRLTL